MHIYFYGGFMNVRTSEQRISSVLKEQIRNLKKGFKVVHRSTWHLKTQTEILLTPSVTKFTRQI